MTLRLALLAVSLLLPAIVAASAPPTDAAAQQDGDTTPVDVVIELRIWQHVDDAADLWVSAQSFGGDWDTLGTVPLPLGHDYYAGGDPLYNYYRYGDLTVAGATLRILQSSDSPEQFFVCAHRCPYPWTRTLFSALDAVPLRLDDGHSPDGQYRYGDLKMATVPGNPGLLADRLELLRLRDTLAGTGTLDWAHDTSMTTWTGVTIGGTAPRVRELNLTGRGLTGELSGLLGNLTSLDELWLDGNTLTGAIPSKLGQLAGLTHVYLGGNALTRCIPPSLSAVANNDLDSLGLPDCRPPIETYSDAHTVLSDGTFLYRRGTGRPEPPLILDVPAGIRITIQEVGLHHDNRYWLIVRDADSHFSTRLNLPSYREWGRSVDPDKPEVSAAFARIMESRWVGALDTPSRPNSVPSLTALAGGRAGEILLEWTIASEDATRWQYRRRGPGEGATWDAWTNVPGSDASTRSHRLSGLRTGQHYAFEVRPWTASGVGDASYAVEAVTLQLGADGIPIAIAGQALEGGHTFRVGGTVYTFTAPRRLRVALREWTQTSDGSIRITWEWIGFQGPTYAYVTYDTALGKWVDRFDDPDDERLIDHMLDSIREDPLLGQGLPSQDEPPTDGSGPAGPIAPAVAITLLGLVALAVARWRGRV